jgi:4-carboxymuconolactone decarboxylase
MAANGVRGEILAQFDDATRTLVRVAAVVAAGEESDVRAELQRAATEVRHEWVEELLLQTYLFAGFPRALNAMREWRRHAPGVSSSAGAPIDAERLRIRGEDTCATVYGNMYDRLRENVRALHPLLDDWMIVEGYGKVLSRPALDLGRRELCIVAACAASGQDRQLLSHLHGALNASVDARVVTDALAALRDLMPEALFVRAGRLWDRIRQQPR